MPPEISALINLIGAPAVIVLVLILRDWYQGRSETKQSDAITDIAVNEIADRKQLQESNNRLQSEVFEIRLEQAKEAGRREEMRITSDKNEAKIVTLEARLLELEKNWQDSKAHAQQLEAEIEELKKQIAAKDDEIEILQLQKRALETELENQRNRAQSLSDQIQKMQDETARQSTAQSVDDTVTGVPEPPQAATVTPVTVEPDATNETDNEDAA